MDNIDVSRAIGAPFQDKAWVNKTVLGWLWGFLVVTSPAVTGFMLDYIKGVAEGRDELPEWNDFGGKWVRGFLVLVAGFIYFLPVIALALVFVVPAAIASAMAGRGAGAFLGGGLCLFWLFALVYFVLVAIVFYAAVVNYAMSGDFGAFFRFSDVMAHVRDGSGYFMAWLVTLGAAFVAGAVGGAIPVLGWIISPALTFLALMIGANALGQWARGSYHVAMAAPVGGYMPPPPPAAPGYVPPSQPPAPYVSPAVPPMQPSAPPAPPASMEPPAPPAYAQPAAAPVPVAPPAAPSEYAPPPAPPAAPPMETPPPAAPTKEPGAQVPQPERPQESSGQGSDS